MTRISEFQKVSLEQFTRDFKADWEALVHAGEPFPDLEYKDEDLNELAAAAYENVKIPERATKGSAGYDFVSPIDFTLATGCTIKIPTGIRAQIEEGWVLMIYPRSGLGFKYRLQLDNCVGVVDTDYYASDNEGHIFLKLTNDGKRGKKLEVKAGDRIAQGIFMPFGITHSDRVTAKRFGGMGSTGK